MRKNNAVLCSCVPSVDEEGRVTMNVTTLCSIKGIMIPVSSELAAKGFGFDENISHRFFCKEKSEHICAGNVVKYNDADYSIVHVADYGKVKVLHLNTLIGNQNVRSVVQGLRY